MNCFAQCASCNLKHEHDAHPFTSFFLNKYSQSTWDELHLRYITPRKFKNWELEEMIAHYTKLVKISS